MRKTVWDPLVRLTHWSVAALVLGQFINEDGGTLHRWAGYAVLALVAVRIVWGFVGSRHARFADWFPTPARLRHYLHSVRSGRPHRYVGHNPAGALMMLSLWALLGALGFSGWLMGTDEYWGVEWLQDSHEAIAYTLLGCVVVHVGAAIVTGLRHGENLIASMIHGRKRVDNSELD